MDEWIITMMMSASIFLGLLALLAFLWAIKNGQFDDEERFLNAVHFDDENELNDAISKEKKQEDLKKKYKEKNYKPED